MTSPEPSTPIAELRQATHALHARLDSHPYAARVMDGTVALPEYAAFLRALVVVHRALQQARDACTHAEVRALVPAETDPALPALARDLAHLATLGVAAVLVPPAADRLAVAVQNLSSADPRALAGILYVLEGSKLGGLVQSAALAKVQGLEAGGRDYLAGAGSGTRARFRDFIARLNVVLAGDTSAAVAAAVTTFEGFEGILESVSAAGRNGA